MRIIAFDSGIGGLSAVAPLFKRIPDLRLTYLGDLANLPYGTKSPARVADLVAKNLQWLLKESIADAGAQPDLAILACNTASAHALETVVTLCSSENVPALGVLEPGCRLAIAKSPKRILVLATASTVSSGAYEQKIRELGFKGPVVSKACPLFVSLVEDDLTQGVAAEAITRRYLDDLQLTQGDAVILGCTHYPFLLDTLKRIYPTPMWIEASAALIEDALLKSMGVEGIDREPTAGASLDILFTDSTASLASVKRMLARLGLEKLGVTTRVVTPIV